MRILTILMASALVMGACRDDGHGHEEEEDYTLDPEKLAEVQAKYEAYADIADLVVETTVAANGCTVPKWFNTQFFEFQESTNYGMGVHIIDISYDITLYEEERARIIQYDQDENGGYILAGLEWYFEPLNGEQPDEPPKLFGIPMDGMMEPHIPGQDMHYDVHGWFWSPHESLIEGVFGEYNPALPPPSWVHEAKYPMLESFSMHSPDARQLGGWTDSSGECISTAEGDAGFPLVNPALVGSLDPMEWDTVLLDARGRLLGVQWTHPDDGNGPPAPLFGQEFHLEGDNYVLRMWQGDRTSTKGLFEPYLDTFACDEPLPPEGC